MSDSKDLIRDYIYRPLIAGILCGLFFFSFVYYDELVLIRKALQSIEEAVKGNPCTTKKN